MPPTAIPDEHIEAHRGYVLRWAQGGLGREQTEYPSARSHGSARPCHVLVLRDLPAASPARLLPALTDRDGGHDEGVPEEERWGLGREVAAEILKEQVLFGLLLGTPFGSHGGAKARTAQMARRPAEALAPPPRPPYPLRTRQRCARRRHSRGAEQASPGLARLVPQHELPGVIGRARQTSAFLVSLLTSSRRWLGFVVLFFTLRKLGWDSVSLMLIDPRFPSLEFQNENFWLRVIQSFIQRAYG